MDEYIKGVLKMELTRSPRPSLIAVLLLPALCAGCAASAAGKSEHIPEDLIAAALPYCRMMAEPVKYVGSEIAISALFSNTPHGGVIYGKECQSWSHLRGSGEDSPQAKAIFADAYRHNRNPRFQVMVIGVLRSNGARHEFEKSRIIVALPLGSESGE